MNENSLLSELSYHGAQGALRYRGVRYLLIRPETLIALQGALEAEIGRERTAAALHAGGFTGGKLSGQKYRQEFGLSDREAVEFMCRMGGEIGWGHFRLVELDADSKRLVVEVDSSAFAEGYSKGSPTPVCHLTRGVMAGLLSGLTSSEVRSQETLCLAKGDERCRFEIEALA